MDYRGLGGRRYIGTPKQPTVSIYRLQEGVYQGKHYRQDEQIESLTFPDLALTAAQIWAKAR